MNNESAFSTYFTSEHALSMTLRDYFAAKAIIAYHSDGNFSDSEDVANWCYKIADAMMKAREA